MADSKGASNNERLLAAAKSNNDDLILEVFKAGGFDINFADGLGNTALHYAAQTPSPDVLEHILEHEECDVDPQNRLDRSTPLHLAVRLQDQAARKHIVESLLEAGADFKIPNKHGTLPLELVPADDTETRALFRKAQAEASISHADIANDSDGEPGSGSDDE